MYEIDFLPVESENGSSSKSGDAIAIRFTVQQTQQQAVIVIDAGYQAIGENLVNHINHFYQTNNVDLVISTHPDADHLNGLPTVLERMQVTELMVHQPRLHSRDVSDFSNLEALDNLIKVARQRGTKLSEPFRGETRFGGQLTILGPTVEYYQELLEQHLFEEKMGLGRVLSTRSLVAYTKDLLEYVLSGFPEETLTDEGETSPRNNSSAITLLQVDGHRLLFTGDAGIPALQQAADYYESLYGSFRSYPLNFLQAPHHGSKRNLGPTILNQILGMPNTQYRTVTAFISSAKASKKHPSPKIVNALSRRGCEVCATEGRSIQTGEGAPYRWGWTTLQPIPPLSENEDD
ncbi:MBL fold metallo-hydrolase [Microbispora sp. H13382]|uniref:ComEC/Rec2 family competence protein n=1 Tax=Microbispora sp. H13382 TaxID=2729112 RepID=UPI001602AB14|nr:MBL fold metallo-hydrolase [Microbispora sp. H13382]